MEQPAQPVKKSQQHHVWQEYLRSWADSDGAIFCLQNGRVFSTGTAVIGVGKDFYKIGILTEADVTLIKVMGPNERHHPSLRKTVETFLGHILMPTMIVRRFPGVLKDAGFAEWLDIYYTNAVDDRHTMLERSFIPLLHQSLREDISWYEIGVNRLAFYTYIAAQNLRTRRVKARIIARLRARMGLDFSRIWNVLAVVYAFFSGHGMFADPKLTLTLVRNRTDVLFVTGDQPVANLDADGETGPALLSFFYPLSPLLALYLSEPGSKSIPALIDSADTVMELNLRIARTTHSQVYASNAKVLEDMRDHQISGQGTV